MNNVMTFLLEQAQDRETQASLALSKARSELEQYYQQLAQIEQYRLDYCQQLVERGQQGLTASQYGHLNRFLTQLDETLSKQKLAETHFQAQVTKCEQNWFEARKQRRSYEWLIEKKQKEAQKQQSIKEQKLMDEFATLRYSRTQSPF